MSLPQAMLEDKIRATDFEATSEAIEEQVAHESYLQWLRENDQRSKGQVWHRYTLFSRLSPLPCFIEALNNTKHPSAKL